MNNWIDLASIMKSYRVGLMFSIFEGLKQGESIRFRIEIDPSEIQDQFVSANSLECEWNSEELEEGGWEIVLAKKMAQKNSGCCGACGG